MVSQILQALFKDTPFADKKLVSSNAVSGGSINDAYQVVFENDQRFFVKTNTNAHVDFFEKEADNLMLLSKNGLPAPVPVFHTDRLLVLPWIEPGNNSESCMSMLGYELARLHSIDQMHCGLAYDNYMGSLPQSNKVSDRWESFYMEQRLLPLAKHAMNDGLLNAQDISKIEGLVTVLEDFPNESISLLHGDLWSGNVLCGAENAWFIDPACYCGHREVDIAMTHLFGGFTQAFYDAYESENPLTEDWKERLPMWLLYPLLVHIRLFGSGYVQQFRRQLSFYS